MILIYVSYLWYTTKHDALQAQAKERGHHTKQGIPFVFRLFEITIGIVILLFSADLVMDNAMAIAEHNGLSEAMVGVLIVGAAVQIQYEYVLIHTYLPSLRLVFLLF